MRVLYLGPDSGTSRHRARAFERLGHQVRVLDPRKLLPSSSLVDRIEWQLHPAPLSAWVRHAMRRELAGLRFDLAFADGGALIGPGTVSDLRQHCARVVNFNHDDPFGPRDGVRFASYRLAVPQYDLLVVVRSENVAEARAHGARRVLYTYRTADEVEHAPRELDAALAGGWSSQVAFVGTWMPERGPFLADLMQRGVPVAIFGGGWHKAPEWPRLRAAHRAAHLEGQDYGLAVQCAKINLGLLSSGNRDLHTTRSLEIPALGSVFCAQRTSEHETLYRDGEEAVFWNTTEECARLCLELLEDSARRERIAQAGRARCLSNGHFSERLLQRVIDEAYA